MPRKIENRGHLSRQNLSKEPDTMEDERLQTQVGYNDKLQSYRDPDDKDDHADELSEDNWQFVQKFSGYVNQFVSAARVVTGSDYVC